MPTKNIDRQEFVNGFVDKDFMIVEYLQGLTITYKPDINKRDTTIINQKLFYKMNYGSYVKKVMVNFIYIFQIVLKIMEFFMSSRIEEDGGENILSSGNDFDQINNVLATFNCIED